MSFKISDKVVCVDGTSPSDTRCVYYGESLPIREGTVYTIREIFVSPPGFADAGGIGIKLVGVFARHVRGIESTWLPTRFRLLSEVQAENRLRAGQHAPQ